VVSRGPRRKDYNNSLWLGAGEQRFGSGAVVVSSLGVRLGVAVGVMLVVPTALGRVVAVGVTVGVGVGVGALPLVLE